MDLLRYLVSPSKDVHLPRRTARQDGGSDTSAPHAEDDALDDLVSALEDDPVNNCQATAADLEDGEVLDDEQAQSPGNKSAKVCFFTYHGLACKRHAKGKCPNAHNMPEAGERRKVSTHWIGRGVHEEGCGLPLCPWKDGRPAPTKKVHKEPVREGSQRNAEAKRVGLRPASPAAKKRKRRAHWDQPVGTGTNRLALSYSDFDEGEQDEPATKRTRVDYSDLYPSPPPFAPAQIAKSSSCVPPGQTAAETGTTCFFWLHGKCKREKCQLKHALKDPPKMVEPPPGYVQHHPCGLEWCPGDGEAKKERSKEGKGKREQSERYFEAREQGSDDAAEGSGVVVCGAGEPEPWHLDGFE